jgi:hypothetical protein
MTLEVVEAVAQSWEPVVGPGLWTHESGFSLRVPSGWRGSSQADPLLELHHADTRVDVWVTLNEAHSEEGWVALREPQSCARFASFEDCTTWTEQESDPKGGVRERWRLTMGVQVVELWASYPFGNVVAGVAAVDVLWDGLEVSQNDPGSPD